MVGELKGLGIPVSATSVRKVLLEAGLQPAPQRTHSSWRAFLRAQAASTFACGLPTVEAIFETLVKSRGMPQLQATTPSATSLVVRIVERSAIRARPAVVGLLSAQSPIVSVAGVIRCCSVPLAICACPGAEVADPVEPAMRLQEPAC